MNAFVVAAAQFPVQEPASLPEYEATLGEWVKDAAALGAKLVVFPEYAGLIVASTFVGAARTELTEQVEALQAVREEYVALHRRLAMDHGVYLLAGSLPWRLDGGGGAPARLVNRAWFFAPNGDASFQDKRMMTRFERESWDVTGGDALRVFDTRLGRIGVCICYDSEFPLLARALADAGVTVLLVPSCTDARAGYERVRVGCQARALENQFFVVQAPLVGELAWSPAIDVNVGRAGIFGPPDRGFPDDGVIAEGKLNEPGWVLASIDPDAVARVRDEGQVRPYLHWPEQGNADALAAAVGSVPFEVLKLGV